MSCRRAILIGVIATDRPLMCWLRCVATLSAAMLARDPTLIASTLVDVSDTPKRRNDSAILYLVSKVE